ncbi:MAG: hypothetical protein L6R39_004338 [Caloplaca ligustica]|nr:MAG: hypothetical protein L6R39_004338 [Caloplaca ligustica]
MNDVHKQVQQEEDDTRAAVDGLQAGNNTNRVRRQEAEVQDEVDYPHPAVDRRGCQIRPVQRHIQSPQTDIQEEEHPPRATAVLGHVLQPSTIITHTLTSNAEVQGQEERHRRAALNGRGVGAIIQSTHMPEVQSEEEHDPRTTPVVPPHAEVLGRGEHHPRPAMNERTLQTPPTPRDIRSPQVQAQEREHRSRSPTSVHERVLPGPSRGAPGRVVLRGAAPNAQQRTLSPPRTAAVPPHVPGATAPADDPASPKAPDVRGSLAWAGRIIALSRSPTSSPEPRGEHLSRDSSVGSDPSVSYPLLPDTDEPPTRRRVENTFIPIDLQILLARIEKSILEALEALKVLRESASVTGRRRSVL